MSGAPHRLCRGTMAMFGLICSHSGCMLECLLLYPQRMPPRLGLQSVLCRTGHSENECMLLFLLPLRYLFVHPA